MTIDQAIFEHCTQLLSDNEIDATLAYSNAKGIKPPYIVMNKIADPEDRVTLQEAENSSGVAEFQFSAWKGGESDASETLLLLDPVKMLVVGIRGIIGTAPDQFCIDFVAAGGCIEVNDGAMVNAQYFGSVFRAKILWHKV
jgi:hypothetical protein